MEQFKSIRFDSISMGKLGRIKKKMDDLQEMLKRQIHCGAATYLSPALETAYMYCESAVKKDQIERFKARADSNKEAAKVDHIYVRHDVNLPCEFNIEAIAQLNVALDDLKELEDITPGDYTKAINLVKAALHQMDLRTQERESRGVEGKNKA